jgi:hypothetical protein
MAAVIDIDYEADGHAYKAVFSTQDFGSLAPVIQEENQNAASWEAFIAAVVKKAKNHLEEVLFYKDGALHDGPNGEAAQQFFADGVVVHATHYEDGDRTLVQDFNAAGKVVQTMQFADDYTNDTAEGEPAIRIFDDKGNLTYAEYNTHGKKNDGANGAPARQWFEGGKLVKAISCKSGGQVGEDAERVLTPEEVAACPASQQPQRKKAPAAKARM